MPKCAICGARISRYVYDLSEYVYKREAKYFCGWGCMREYDRSRTKKPIAMQWHISDGEVATARGKYGRFTIKRGNNGFTAIYRAFDNSRKKIGIFKDLEEAQRKCENDTNWEM